MPRHHITREYLEDAIAKRRTAEELAVEIGCVKSTIYNNLRKHGLVLPEQVVLKPTYGMLTPLRRIGASEKGVLIECLCECGNISVTARHNLLAGNTTSCGCKAHRRGADSPLFKGHKHISGKYWSNLKKGAKTRGLTFDISIEYAWGLFVQQTGECALTGWQISLVGGKGVQTASLDRVDSTLGYEVGNVWWVHKIVNRAKLDFPLDDFLALCRAVAIGPYTRKAQHGYVA